MEGAVLPSGGDQDALSPQGCSHVPCPACPSCPSPGGRAGMWAGSSGAEAAGGQAQAGLFYSRLFPAKKTESDTSTPRGTSCRYPARSCWSPGPVRRHRLCSWGSGRKGTAPLMGGRTAGCWGRATSCGREGQTRYPPSKASFQHPPYSPAPQPLLLPAWRRKQGTGPQARTQGQQPPCSPSRTKPLSAVPSLHGASSSTTPYWSRAPLAPAQPLVLLSDSLLQPFLEIP